MKIYLSVDGEPVGKGRPRFTQKGGFPRAFTPPKTKAYEDLIEEEYKACYPRFVFAPNRPLLLIVNAFMPIPKSTPKKSRLTMIQGEARPIKKPDADNILKSVADALNGVAYEDDKQIVSMTINKYYSENSRTEIIIEEI